MLRHWYRRQAASVNAAQHTHTPKSSSRKDVASVLCVSSSTSALTLEGREFGPQENLQLIHNCRVLE